MRSFCQFILGVLFLSLAGCSWFSAKPDFDPRTSYVVEPVWFKNKSIRLANLQGDPLPHLFYDPAATFNLVTGRVNFLPLVLAGDESAYDLDVLSGQRFFSHFQCSQSDVWKERGGISSRATYTLGVIPRHFDQLNQPQRVIVFGGRKRFDVHSPIVYQVRVLGGFVEELCPAGRCSGPKDWVGRMVFVAVDEADAGFADVSDFAKLLKKIDWQEIRGQLENIPGRNSLIGTEYPAIRVGNLLNTREILDFFKKYSISLSTKELASMQTSCANLYDIFWQRAGVENMLDKPALSNEEVRKRAKFYDDLKKKGQPAYFGQRLGVLFKKYGDELSTCARLVYAGDPNLLRERFVFQAWVNIFTRLHKEGWEYDCRAKAWSVSNQGAEAMRSLRTLSEQCTARDFDLAMDTLPAQLKNARLSGERWRFIGWDEHPHGTHSKVLNWVRVPERIFACGSDERNVKIRESWSERPDGMDWKKRHTDRGLKDSDYIY
jgi:hypothetical protein